VNTPTNGKIYGITGRYTSGPIRAQFDWAVNKVASTEPARTAGDPKITGMKAGLGWAYAPGSQVSGIIGRLTNDNILATSDLGAAGVAAGTDVKQNFWLLNWEHMIGPWQLLAQYYQNGKIKGLDNNQDTSSKAYTLAAKYYLSKRTGVYASYTTVRNDQDAWADASGGGFSSACGTAGGTCNAGGSPGAPATAGLGSLGVGSAGADIKVWGIGVMHNF
jgi:predicted porin